MTGMSVVATLLISGVEVLGLLSSHLSSPGPIWKAVNRLSGHLSDFGFTLAGVFVVCWPGSAVVHRSGRTPVRE